MRQGGGQQSSAAAMMQGMEHRGGRDSSPQLSAAMQGMEHQLDFIDLVDLVDYFLAHEDRRPRRVMEGNAYP